MTISSKGTTIKKPRTERKYTFKKVALGLAATVGLALAGMLPITVLLMTKTFK